MIKSNCTHYAEEMLDVLQFSYTFSAFKNSPKFFFYRLNLASILSDEHKVSNEIPKVANEVLPEVRKSKY